MSRSYRSLLVLFAALVLVLPAVAEDDLEDLLSEVGADYAEAYVSPLIHGFGANQNSALYHTAHIPHTKLTWSIGLKFMGTQLNEDDQTFRSVFTDVELSNFLPTTSPFYNQDGNVVLEGPTVIGDSETEGTLTAYVGGLPVYQTATITGQVDTRWIPLAAPQLDVGGFYGVRGSLRWLPEYELEDYGKTKYMGYGLSWNPGFLLPPLPVDVMIGFFRQQIDLGALVETEASSIYIAASKNYGPLIAYAGLAKESSTMKVAYTFDEPGYDPVDVAFEVDGDMGGRFTLGGTLDLPVKVNLEMNVGSLVVYSAGLMFGM